MVAAGGPVIPNFGQGSSCVTGDHTFCWGWVKEHWHDTLEPQLVYHVELSLVAVAIGFVLAFGLAILAHRVRPIAQPLGVVSALIYTIPSIAIFQILLPFFGVSSTTIAIPLVGYSLVLIYPNVLAGLESAPPDVLEAARGMGFTQREVFQRIELPLAIPAIIGGLRIAVVSTVSIATIASYIGGNGLGRPIFDALQLPTPFKTEIYAAGALVVALALTCDLVLVGVRRILAPWPRT